MLLLNNVTKKFDANLAVDKVSFRVDPGEIFALIGPNGSGKTTIVKMIAGLLRPNEGEISVGKQDTVEKPIEAKSKIGYIPDEPVVWGKMTGEEFLYFSGALFGMSQKKIAKEIEQWLSIFKLNGIEKSYFENYSRGNKQKFSIIAAMMHGPKLLLVDEPVVGLDPTSAETAKKKFSEFARSGGAVFLVTHTLSFAEDIATRIGVLHKGKLLKTGTLSELRLKARLKEDANLEKIYKAFVK